MSQAITKTINLQEVLLIAIKETEGMRSIGIDISDPAIITPLEAIANQYPELAAACNQSLMELVKEVLPTFSQQQQTEIINEF